MSDDPAAASASRLGNVAGVVLTGGASRRMGRDKAHLMLAGVACATRLARLLSTLVQEVILVGGDPPADAPGRRVADAEGPPCALRGLVAGLAAASSERVLVVATDLPLLEPELLLALVAWPEADVVLPRTSQGLQPLCALYRRERALAVARSQLGAERLALHALLDELELSVLGADALAALDPEGRALANLNTPEDVQRVERWLGAAG